VWWAGSKAGRAVLERFWNGQIVLATRPRGLAVRQDGTRGIVLRVTYTGPDGEV
jgi:hypothetical protein